MVAKVSPEKVATFHIALSKFNAEALGAGKLDHAQIALFEACISEFGVVKAAAFNIAMLDKPAALEPGVGKICPVKLTAVEAALLKNRT